MTTKASARAEQRAEAETTAADVERKLQRMSTPEVVDELRAQTGCNPRQRLATAFRLMLTVVEGFLVGQTLSFTAPRAIFARRFGVMRPCPFQRRFKQAEAGAFAPQPGLASHVESGTCSSA